MLDFILNFNQYNIPKKKIYLVRRDKKYTFIKLRFALKLYLTCKVLNILKVIYYCECLSIHIFKTVFVFLVDNLKIFKKNYYYSSGE